MSRTEVSASQVCCHTEATLLDAIHRLARTASTCRIAVAYCGKGGYRFLPEAADERPENLRIVVDASDATIRHGLTNPKGLLSLLGLTAELRSLACLHSKVWIFDERVALVGSANMSESSIEQQYQLVLEVSDQKTVRQLLSWFDKRIWNHPEIHELNERAIRKKLRLMPVHPPGLPSRKTGVRVPKWRGEAPEPPLIPTEFIIGAKRSVIRRLLAEFRSNQCKHLATRGASCAEFAVSQEKRYKEKVHEFRALWRRRNSWNKNHLAKLFDLAYTHGRAAKVWKPVFVRQAPRKVMRSLEFLFEGDGDPYVRFEKLLARGRYRLRGLGKAGLTFLMHLWDPARFAIVNGPIDKSLTKLSVTFKGSQREGQAFKNRTAAVHALAKLTGLKTFGRVDHFLAAIAQGHIGQSDYS